MENVGGISLISAASFLNAFPKILQKSSRRKLASISPEACSYFLDGSRNKSRKKRLLPTGHWNGEYRKRFAAIGKMLSKRVIKKILTLN